MKALPHLVNLWLLLSPLLSSAGARPAPADDPSDPAATACPGGTMPDNYMQIDEAINHNEVPPAPICPQAGQPGVGPPSQWQSQASSKPADPPENANPTSSASSSAGTTATAAPSEPSAVSSLQPDDQGQIRIPHKCLDYTPVDTAHGNLNAPTFEGWADMCKNACAEYIDQAKKAGQIPQAEDPPCPCVSGGKYYWDADKTIYKMMYGYKVSWGDCICLDVAADALVTDIGTIVIDALPQIAQIGSQILLQAFEMVLAAPLNLIPGLGEVADAAVAAIGAAKLCDFAYDAATGFKAFYNWAKNVKDFTQDTKTVYNNLVKSDASKVTGKPWEPPPGVTKGGGKLGDKGAPNDWDKAPPGKDDNKPPDDGKPDDGKPDDGKPDDGKPDDGKPDDGKPDDGKPDDGKPDNGKPDKDKPDKNKPKKCKNKNAKGGKAGTPP